MIATALPEFAPSRSERKSGGAILLVGLLSARWLAGIAEDATFAGLSEIVALAMTAALAVCLLNRMQINRNASVLVAGLVAWMFVAILSVAANGIGNVDAIALITLLALYALFANTASQVLSTPDDLQSVRHFLTGFVVIGAALAFWQVVTRSGFVELTGTQIVRAYGSDVHPVSFAIQLVGVAVGLEVIRLKSRQAFRLSHMLLLLLAGTALYLTFARTAWAMAVICLAVYFWHSARGPLRVPLAMFAVVSGAVLIIASGRFADLSSLPLFLQNFSFTDAQFDYRFIDNSVSWRIVNWSVGLQQALEQPFLGFGAGQSATSSYFQLEMHNIFLEQFFEGGIAGVLAFLIVVAGLWCLHARLPKLTRADRRAAALANGFGLSLLAAASLSTSLVDQLMSILLYLLVLASSAVPSGPTDHRNAAMLSR